MHELRGEKKADFVCRCRDRCGASFTKCFFDGCRFSPVAALIVLDLFRYHEWGAVFVA